MPTEYFNEKDMDIEFDCDICGKTFTYWSDAEKCEESHNKLTNQC